jgi:N6-adenosine-specific RNA methylase IME4
MNALCPTAAAYTERIASCWRQSLDAFLEAGRLLIEAKRALPHGDFEAMVRKSLPFEPRTAQMLMKIAADRRLTNPNHGSLLPPHWRTLYELTRLDDDTFAQKIADGAIRPDLERSEVARIRKDQRTAPDRDALGARKVEGCTVTDLHRLAANGYRAGAVLADPPWRFITRSARGEGRSASQHYQTSPLDVIKALPVASLAADISVLFLWVVDWLLDGALEVIASWGFTYKTVAFTWVKQNRSGDGLFTGMGYWTRANTELCLFATRGNPKRLHADVPQVLLAPVMEHSRKPDEIHDRIERLVPGPYIELYARRERPDWIAWGDELPRLALSSFPTMNLTPAPVDGAAPESSACDDLLDIPTFLRRGHPDCLYGSAERVTARTVGLRA